MGLYSTLNTGVTGLSVNSTSMNVIGDNIANVNTTGFKANRASFQDILVQNVIGSAGTTQLGRGASLSSISLTFAQGAFENSSNVTDMAINGQGFFVLRGSNEQEQLYSRAGQFFLDASGRMVNPQGLFVQGYNATSTGVISTVVEDIQIDTGPQAPSATDTIEISANLNAEEAAATAATTIPTAATQHFYTDLNDNANFSTSVTVYDSLGQAHDLTTYYQKTGTNTWSFTGVVNTAEVTGGVAATGDATVVSSGTLVFQTDGTLDTTLSAVANVAWGGFLGSDPAQTFTFDLSTNGNLTQYGQSSALTAVSQNGFSSGYLSYLDINVDGIVTGIYTNGQRKDLAQVALANFQSIDGLERRGGNLLAATTDSQEPAIGAAGSGGRGSISPYSLELSNVDLETEFVRMIASQLGYQANSRVISTTSEMMQQLIQVVR